MESCFCIGLQFRQSFRNNEMTHLYLVQHGAAKAEAEDPKRGLTAEGRHDVERMAEFLFTLHLPLDRIEHSGKRRAKETAEILAERLRPTEGSGK